MASPKRKRQPTRTTSNKRLKYTQPDTDSGSSGSSSSSDNDDDPTNHSQIEWEALRILAQTGTGFGLRYLIEWKGIDPATGEQWEPTWEGAKNASDSLRASWKKEQALQLQKKRKTAATAARSTLYQSAPEIVQAQATQTRATRQRRTIESPETSTSPSATEPPTEISPTTSAAPSKTTINIGTPIPYWTSPQVNIYRRGDSLNPNEYEPHTEIPESPLSPARSNSDDNDLDSSQLFSSQRGFCASGIVPDTQSSVGDVSYIPVTQEDLDSSLHSDSADESTEGNIIGYSGLLDTNTDAALRLGARAQSPATSIAETVADTTQDLQSQRQVESQQEQSEIPETLESPVASNKSDQTTTQNNSIGIQYTATAHLKSSAGRHESCSLEQLAFIDNTTQSEHETPPHNFQPQLQEQGVQVAPTEVLSEPVDTVTRPASSSAESVTFVVADTPQISQLTSTAQEGTTNKEQTNRAHQNEAANQSVEKPVSLLSTERSVLEEYAQFPFHSQYPASFVLESATNSTQSALSESLRACVSHVVTGTQPGEGSKSSSSDDSVALDECDESTTIDEISQPILQQESYLPPQEPLAPRLSQSQADVSDFDHFPPGEPEAYVEQAGSAVVSHLAPSTEQSTVSHEHNAQLVSSSEYFGTQDDTTESVRATTEHEAEASPRQKSSPCSRHDSSQETPERHSRSVEPSSSPIPHPPSYSLRTLDSNVPPRPSTPTLSSSLSKMAESTGAKIERELKELKEAKRAANPFVSRRERTRAYRAPSVASAGAVSSSSLLQPATAPALPTINVSAEGTRSPSTVPDRSPAPPAQTSLRDLAFANAKGKATEALLENPLAATSSNNNAGPTQEKAELVAAAAAAAVANRPVESPELLADDSTEEMSDIDDNIDDHDEGSVCNDDLQLERNEYIVPLFIEGRQSDTYNEYIKRKSDLLDAVLHEDPIITELQLLDRVEEALTYMKAIETHPDLTYAEAESAMGSDLQSATDVQYGAQFGIENSVKFKFLRELFNNLRKQALHIVLLLDQDNDALFNILRTFFTAADHNYRMPTKGYELDTSNDALTITVFPNTTSPILQPADLVICLDGVQSAAQIRQNNWAVASGKTVPVLHLVISQTVGHIERYIVPNVERRIRIETILAGLGQIQKRNEIGKPVYLDAPGAVEAARLVAFWLFPDDEESTEWPLPSIESVRNFMEYERTQQSVASATSSPAPERTKRPLEADDDDAAKRMRYTPQPHAISGSRVNQQNEVTHISDSMPGTGFSENSHLTAQLEETHCELLRTEREHREKEVMWDKQQTEHENRAQEYRKLLNEKREVDRAHESKTRDCEKLRTQLESKAAEIKALRDELEAQRTLGLISHDEKDVEITRLRKELEITQLDRDRALRSEKSTESTLEYTKEQYRTVSNAAGQLRTDITSLQTENAQLAHQASGEAAKLKQLHLNKSAKNLAQQNKALISENNRLKVTLKQKEDELIRAKSNSVRVGYGTRAQSTTPQPKTRSRATSPTATRGGRGGRIGDLRLE
ncbi:hypothetical protein EKO04_010666 [Ascochyta lentis]|uniref:Chromo domain-containing protein n=1 Tax=Ascochyta lentis TaxID=205686 RepID=A0A8H7IWK3_9PLEO|nr:hypothetical protein EKO04_010666 [Ascochyta lentis]